MKILPIPCLQDHYAYLIIDENSREAAVVDPVEPVKVLMVANDNGVTLKFILATHHHRDHCRGNEKMKELVPGIKVFGGSLDNVQGCTDKLEHGDKISLGSDLNIVALHTPCHTKGHTCYLMSSKGEEDPAVFTGDTLFVGGCGKFFEGSAEEMYQSLCITLGSLPKSTRVYCDHEYTEKNLRFAVTVEPENEQINQKLSWAQQQREANQPTVPSTIGDELDTNPFMRVDLPHIQERLGVDGPVQALAELRRMKDNWNEQDANP